MFRGLTAAAAAFVVGAGLAACDRGSAQEEVGRDRLTACELVTPSAAATALGSQLARPEATDDEGADALAGRSGCAWATEDGRSAVLFELVRTSDMATSVRRTGFSAAARFSAARTRHPDAASVGVGERSMWVEETATLYLLANSSYLVIEVATPRPGDAAGVARAFATVAVKRLQSPALTD